MNENIRICEYQVAKIPIGSKVCRCQTYRWCKIHPKRKLKGTLHHQVVQDQERHLSYCSFLHKRLFL